MIRRLTTAAFCSVVIAGSTFAHHSFAPYDIRNPIEFNGVAEDFVYRRPHPMLTLIDEQGVSWEIEVPIRFWERAGLPQDAIKPGDELRVFVHPARNGDPEAALGGFEVNGTYHSIHEEVGQQSGNAAADAIEAGESLDSVLDRFSNPE